MQEFRRFNFISPWKKFLQRYEHKFKENPRLRELL